MTEQELLKKFNHQIVNQNFFDSIILESMNNEQLLNTSQEIVRMMFCKNNALVNDYCDYCNRSMSKNLLDVIYVGDGFTKISKQEVQNIIEVFSLTSKEIFNKKIYLINVAENLSAEAANSLLIFLEEPKENVYALLLSRDKSSILPTIKSRCKSFTIESKVETIDNNLFLKLFKVDNFTETLLFVNEFKNVDKDLLLKMLDEAINSVAIFNKENILENLLILKNDLLNYMPTNLSISNFLINISESGLN